MGKDSLIKSTTKKKANPKEAKETKKKKVTKAAATKKAVKATKAKSKPKSKTTTKKPAAKKTASKKRAATKTAKKVAVKDLIFKSFSPSQKTPPKPLPPRDTSAMTAPPFIDTGDPQEDKRLKELLFRRFDMVDVKAAAKPPKPPATKAVVPEAVIEPQIEPETTSVQAEGPPVSDQGAFDSGIPPLTDDAPADPVQRAMKYGVAALVIVFLLLVWASYTNSVKYYVSSKKDALEIHKGLFSPTGNDFFIVLHGLQLSEPAKEVYSRQDIFPVIFNYFLEKADALLETDGLPDFEGIKGYLLKAEKYAFTSDMHNAVDTRLNNIGRMILLYKVDVAISKNTEEGLQLAMQYLKQAQRLSTDPVQKEAIKQKMAFVAKRQADLKETKADKPPAPEKPAPSKEAAPKAPHNK